MKLYRLQKAHSLLKNDTATVAEIAYKVGFNSPSYFTKCFHDHYKHSPGDIKNRSAEMDTIKSSVTSLKSAKFKIEIIVLFSLLIVGFLSYVIIFDNSIKNNSEKTYSIAVLPFKNLSNDESNQYFADGVMDVILSHLSKLEGFRVISRTTMEQYRETSKSIPEIAKELKIAYILEASLQKENNKIRIVTQLIDAEQDNHLWANNYVSQYQDIFDLQSAIAKDVAKNLKITVTPSQIEQIDKTTTKNFEAYNLYLKGRFFWHRRTEEDLKKSKYYFEQAIIRDSNYALAYAGLADSYFIMAWWGWYDRTEGFKKANEYALRALSIDSNLSSAYAVLGGVNTWSKLNWEQAEIEFKEAINLDPNYATAYQYYAELLEILGRFGEAKEQISLALKHNPNSTASLNISAEINYNSGDFKEALEDTKRSFEIMKGAINNLDYVRYYIGLGGEDKAFEHLKNLLPDSSNNSSELNLIFRNGGITKVISKYADSINLPEREYNFSRAVIYCISGERQKAIEYLEESYKAKEPQLLRMKSELEFQTLKNEPRFIALLKKINLI